MLTTVRYEVRSTGIEHLVMVNRTAYEVHGQQDAQAIIE